MTNADQKKASHWLNGYVTEELIIQRELTEEQLDIDFEVDDIIDIVKKGKHEKLVYVTNLILDRDRLVDLWKLDGIYYITRIAYDEGIVEISELA